MSRAAIFRPAMLPATLAPFLLAAALCLAPPAVAAKAYVSNEKDNNISVIDLDSMTVTGTLETGKRPRGLALSHDNKLLYICASDSDTVQVMDLASGRIVRQLPSGADPEQFAFELHGIMLAYFHAYRLLRDPRAGERARRAFEAVLADCRITPQDETADAAPVAAGVS